MSVQHLAFRAVSFGYDTAHQNIFNHLSLTFPRGFSGVTGANGSGKTTLMRLATGQLHPIDGHIESSGSAIYCPQRTDKPPAVLPELLLDNDGTTWALRGRLGIEDDFDERWDSLSHGERKRAQIASALWQQPDVLAIDEPTNHLDTQARQQLMGALAGFKGIGLLVSHDRQALDALCTQCIWVSTEAVEVFPGGYTKAMAIRQENQQRAVDTREKAVKQHKALLREQSTRRQQEEKAHRALSKRKISPRDHDAKGKVNLAKVSNGGGGKRLNQLDGRLSRAQLAVESTQVKQQADTGIWLPGSTSRRSHLLSLSAGEVMLGDYRRLQFPDLVIRPTDRIALTGANGLGKSRLISHILPLLNLEEPNLIYLPQEVTARQSANLITQVTQLADEQLGHVMTVVKRLGTDPARLLNSAEPSPGETRKLLIALGMSQQPHLIIMDEPTNHLDLPSIEALQSALVSSPCSLLLISHDQQFVDALTQSRWQIDIDTAQCSRLTVL